MNSYLFFYVCSSHERESKSDQRATLNNPTRELQTLPHISAHLTPRWAKILLYCTFYAIIILTVPTKPSLRRHLLLEFSCVALCSFCSLPCSPSPAAAAARTTASRPRTPRGASTTTPACLTSSRATAQRSLLRSRLPGQERFVRFLPARSCARFTSA